MDGGLSQRGSIEPLFGRDTDLELIREFLERIAVRGGALLVFGDAGIGKSALLDVAAAEAMAAGTRALRAAGAEFEANLSFAGLNQVLHPLLGELESLSAAHERALSVALGLSDGAPPDQLLVSNAAHALLVRSAIDQPLLVVIDDLPWLDRASARVLGFVARRLAGSRVGFLASSRTGEESFFERGGLPGHELKAIDSAAAAALLKARFPALAARVSQRLQDEAHGNPLALLELPAALTEPQRSAAEALPTVLPLGRRLQSMFAARVTALPGPTQDLLLLAALEGTGDLRLLSAAATGQGIDGLAPAERAQLVSVDPHTRRLAFRHPLTRSAIVELSTSDQRRQVHRSLAEQLVDQPERRAWHLAEGSVEPDEQVASLLEDVAQRIMRRGHAVGAITALLRAAELSPDGSEHSRRLAMAAYLGANVTGDLRTVPQLLDDAHRADPERAGSLAAAVAASSHLLNGDGDIDTAHRLLVGAIEMQPGPHDANDATLIEAMHTLLLVCFFGGRAELWGPFDRAVARLTPAVPDLLTILRSTFADPARTALPALDRLDAAMANLRNETDPATIVRVGIACAYVDRLPGCRDALWRVVRDGRSGGAVTSAIDALFLLSNEAFLAGQWDEVMQLTEEGLDLCDRHSYQLLAWPGHFLQAAVCAARGDEDLTLTLTDRMTRWAVPRRVGAVQAYASHARALLALGRGDFEDAYQHAAAVSRAGVLASHVPHALWLVMDLVEAGVRAGRHAEAAAHVAAARESGIAAISPRLALVVNGSAAIAATERHDGALFDRALADPQCSRWPFEHARVHLAYGERLRRAKATVRAREHLSAALDTFQRLGAMPWASRARNELRATGLSIGQADATGPLSLTPQQREIAMLAAAGLTNKQIGARLFLSPRTVATHLYQLFPKLGITSRAALRDALAAVPTPEVDEQRQSTNRGNGENPVIVLKSRPPTAT